MKIVAGLGNFGDRYAYTYHNLGFLAAEALADRLGANFRNSNKCSALIAETVLEGEKLVIAKPLTYMNLSGICVKRLLDYYGAGLNSLTVIFDDTDIEKGKIRVRESGSGGTHNGMRHIVETLGSQEFRRIRIGIGRPAAEGGLADYVLSEIPKSERPLMAQAIKNAVDEVIKWLSV